MKTTLNQKTQEKITKIISLIINPFFAPIPILLLINYFTLNTTQFIIIETLSLLFTTIIPLAITIGWSKHIKTDIDISNHQDRITPLKLGILPYFIGAIILYLLHAPILTISLTVAYAINTIVLIPITKKWKISVHAIGIVGPTILLTLQFGLYGSLFGILFPLVAWSRLIQKKHTSVQLIGGAIEVSIIVLLTTILISYIIYGHGIPLKNLIMSIWYALAIILAPTFMMLIDYAREHTKHSKYKKLSKDRLKLLTILIIVLLVYLFLFIAPQNSTIIFLILLLTSIILTKISGKTFSWYQKKGEPKL